MRTCFTKLIYFQHFLLPSLSLLWYFALPVCWLEPAVFSTDAHLRHSQVNEVSG